MEFMFDCPATLRVTISADTLDIAKEQLLQRLKTAMEDGICITDIVRYASGIHARVVRESHTPLGVRIIHSQIDWDDAGTPELTDIYDEANADWQPETFKSVKLY